MALPYCLPAQQNPKLSVAQPEKLVIKRGASATAVLNVSTLEGFHVNSDKPRDEFLIPLQLTWSPGALTPGKITYPPPEDIQVGNDTLSVFTGDFTIKTQFAAPPAAAPGSAEMIGNLRYQACNNRMCFRPATIEVHLPVLVQ